MDLVLILGRMEGNIKVIIRMIKSMAMENIFGQMVVPLKVNGKMAKEQGKEG